MWLKNELNWLLALQADEKLPVSNPLKGRHRKTTEKGQQEWLDILRSLTPEVYQRGPMRWTLKAERLHRRWLVRRLYEAFMIHGPKGFPKEAVFCAIASILIELAIEPLKPHQSLSDLAEALRKRVERATP